MAQQEAIQTPIESKNQLDPATIRLQKKIKRATVRKRLFQLYVLALIIVTGAFGYHLLDEFVLQHQETAGIPEFGNRLEYIQEIPDSYKNNAANFAASLTGVTSATIDNRGAVIFIDVRVEEGVEVETARSQAETIAYNFLNEIGDLANGYNIQIVVSNGDPYALANQNREASIDHIANHFYFLAETTVAHAEEFPTQANVVRAQQNIQLFDTRFNSATNAHQNNFRQWAAASVADLQTRLDAIVMWTEEEEETQLEAHGGNFPNVLQGSERLVQQSNVNDFPSWGIINRENNQFQWN